MHSMPKLEDWLEGTDQTIMHFDPELFGNDGLLRSHCSAIMIKKDIILRDYCE